MQKVAYHHIKGGVLQYNMWPITVQKTLFYRIKHTRLKIKQLQNLNYLTV